MNCLIKVKKNFDFGVNLSVHRNRQFFWLFLAFNKTIMSNKFSNNDPALQFWDKNEYVVYIYAFVTSDYQIVSSYWRVLAVK